MYCKYEGRHTKQASSFFAAIATKTLYFYLLFVNFRIPALHAVSLFSSLIVCNLVCTNEKRQNKLAMEIIFAKGEG